MTNYFHKITIVRMEKPEKDDLNNELQWFSNSLGMFTERDKEKSCFRIFIELLKATQKGKWISSDEIARNAHLSRGTVVYHLNRLIESGFVVSHRRKYMLRVRTLKNLVFEIKKDIDSVFENVEEMAKGIDEELKLLEN